MNSTNWVEKLANIQKEGLELFKKKNEDYGNAFLTYGSIGVLVRIGDKINRLQSITSKNISLVNTESLRDTLIDLHNYSAMAIMLIDKGDNSSNNNVTYDKEYTKDKSRSVDVHSQLFSYMGDNKVE